MTSSNPMVQRFVLKIPFFQFIYSLLIAGAGAYKYYRLAPSILNQFVILYPYLLSNGFVLYNHTSDIKAPLLPQILSWLYPLFAGNAPRSARAMHLSIIIITALLIQWWVYKNKGTLAMVAAGAYFLAWIGLFGYWATSYYEVVLAPIYFAIFGILMLKSERLQGYKLFSIGLLSGISILIKQQSVILIFLITAWFVQQYRDSKLNKKHALRLAFIFLGALFIPLGIYGIYFLIIGGNFGELLYWTVFFILRKEFVAQDKLFPKVSDINQMLPPLLLVVPYITSIFSPKNTLVPSREVRIWLLIFFILSSLFIIPRYSGRHWATAFPFAVVISAIVCADIGKFARQELSKVYRVSIPFAFIAWWFLTAFISVWPRLSEPARLQFGEYSNLIPLAQMLEKKIPDQGGLVIVPVDEGISNLYYLLQRLPPRYYLDFYVWFMEPKPIQHWLTTVEQEKPQTLIYFRDRFELGTYSPEILTYVVNHYQTVEEINWEGQVIELMRRFR